MEYAFVVSALDRRVDWRERQEDLLAVAREPGSDWLIIGCDGRVAVTVDGHLALITGDRLTDLTGDWFFLGMRESRPLFAIARSEAQTHEDSWLDLRTAASSVDAGEAGILAYARALMVWQERHRFCGRCGTLNRLEAGGHRLRCPSCACVSFPRTDPAIIVAVRDGDRCLLGRQPGWPPGRYSTLAGFVEPGETLEAAVAREVMEETGVHVHTCSYAGSQPWPFPASLMLGFEAHARTVDIKLGDELEDARWFDPVTLPAAVRSGELRLPPALSISRWLIERWYRDTIGQPLPVDRARA
jgi:NAD+ diphosphatase